MIIVLACMVGGFALLSYAPEKTVAHLALHPRGVLSGKLWQLLSYSLVNSGCGLIFNAAIVLFFGSAIEREWHTRSFLILWAVVSLVCGLIWMAVSLAGGWELVGLGSSACAYGIIGAFGLLYRRRRFFALVWTVEAQVLALLLIAIGVVLSIPSPITLIWVAGAAVAYLYVRLLWHLKTGARQQDPPKRGPFVEID